MIGPPTNTRVWIAAGVTDLRRGFTGLSGLVQTKLEQSAFCGHVFVFRGRRGDHRCPPGAEMDTSQQVVAVIPRDKEASVAPQRQRRTRSMALTYPPVQTAIGVRLP